MNKINIGISIDLQKLLDTRLLVQAGSGGGKSYLLRKIIESVGNNVQQIILDPEGEFVTLREKFDFALVCKDGDIPLNLKYAETLAHKILETNLSVIIDLYELKHHERISFVKGFTDALVNAPKELWHSCLVYVDEAHIFCPESSKSESMSSIIDLCTRGRKRGFSAILATQRLSKLHKDAAAECLNKMIGRTGLDIDRKRASEELGFTSKIDTLELRNLNPGEFFCFGPALSNEVKKFKVNPVLTTHLQSGKRIVTAPPTPHAIKKILNKLSDIPEEAEKELNTKKQLQDEIIRLKKELLHKSKPIIDDATIREKKDLTIKISQQYQELQNKDKIIYDYKVIINSIKQVIETRPIDKPSHVLPSKSIDLEIKNKKPLKIESLPVLDYSVEPYPLGKCPKSILQFLAQFPDRTFSKAQIGIITDYSPNSGGFNNALGELNSKKLILKEGVRIKINDAINISDWIGEVTHQEYSIETFRHKLPKCEKEIYEVLLAHPRTIFRKEELAAHTPSNYSPNSGGFNNSLGALNTLELIKRQNGTIQLNPELLEL